MTPKYEPCSYAVGDSICGKPVGPERKTLGITRCPEHAARLPYWPKDGK